MRNPLSLVLVVGLAAGLGAPAGAWAQAAAPGIVPPGSPIPARPLVDRSMVVSMAALEAGSNSFTEGQARSRIEEAGFRAISALHLDDRGFWRGQAVLVGRPTDVAMDFRGRIAVVPDPGLPRIGAPGTPLVPPAPAPRR